MKINRPKHCGKAKHMRESSKTTIRDDVHDAKEYGYNKQIKNENNKCRGYTW
jgi:hypothetical protein